MKRLYKVAMVMAMAGLLLLLAVNVIRQLAMPWLRREKGEKQ